MKQTYHISGMSCAACAAVEKRVSENCRGEAGGCKPAQRINYQWKSIRKSSHRRILSKLWRRPVTNSVPRYKSGRFGKPLEDSSQSGGSRTKRDETAADPFRRVSDPVAVFIDGAYGGSAAPEPAARSRQRRTVCVYPIFADVTDRRDQSENFILRASNRCFIVLRTWILSLPSGLPRRL